MRVSATEAKQFLKVSWLNTLRNVLIMTPTSVFPRHRPISTYPCLDRERLHRNESATGKWLSDTDCLDIYQTLALPVAILGPCSRRCIFSQRDHYGVLYPRVRTVNTLNPFTFTDPSSTSSPFKAARKSYARRHLILATASCIMLITLIFQPLAGSLLSVKPVWIESQNVRMDTAGSLVFSSTLANYPTPYVAAAGVST